jgi:PPOX class probable F420-dependent enzyme
MKRLPCSSACRIIGAVIEIDESTELGARVARHLRDDVVVWLTSVSPGGAPLPTVVWFLWDGASSVRVQSLPTAKRVEHVATNPKVSLNFAGDGQGGDLVVFSGRTTIASDASSGDRFDAYAAKYRARMEGMGLTPEQFAMRYSTVLEIQLTRLRGH